MIKVRFTLLLASFLFFKVAASANCTIPALLSAGSITDSSATLTWTDVGDAYQVELRLSSEAFTGVPTHIVNTDPPLTINGLIPGEQYRFRVRTVCTGGGESSWSGPRSFFTDLNNARPCPFDLTIRDTSCNAGGQFFDWHVANAPGNALGTNVLLKGIRLVLTHPWRSDLRIWIISPDGTRIQVIGGLNAGDQNIGNPTGNGGCGQYIELTDDPSATLLADAAEQDNITGFYRSFAPLAGFHTTQNPNGLWQIEICDNKVSHSGKLKLAQLVFESLNCPAPPAVQVSNIGINSAQISWNAGLITGDSIALEYGPAGFVPGNGTLVKLPVSVPQPYTLTNLAALQNWHVLLQQHCTNGLWSGFSAPTAFFTVCPANIVTDFEQEDLCGTDCATACPLDGVWQNAAGDDYEWNVRTGAGITFPTAGPAAASEGDHYLFFRNSCTPSGANGKKAILRTLCLDIDAPAGPACHFSLDIYMNTKTGQMGTLTLEGSIDGGISWQPIQSWSGNRGKQWKREFVNLNAYHQKTALFQLTATGVFGAYGDIAIDNLVFYSATPAGTPDYSFYRDLDQDGFGDDDNRIIACSPTPPSGYVATAGDCNDLLALTHPGAPEIKCNGLDENCNGASDDTFIPAPTVLPMMPVCKGSTAIFSTTSLVNGTYYWYSQAANSAPIANGPVLSLSGLQRDTIFWVADSVASGGCVSARIPVSVTVLAVPELVLGAAPSVCVGAEIVFNQLPVNDIRQTTGTLTYYSGYPGTPANIIAGNSVFPTTTTTYFIQKTTTDGCLDTLHLPVTVYSKPIIFISNGDSIAVCQGRSIALNAVGLPGLQYNWSNGQSINPTSVIPTGNGGIYTVTATDNRGCTATDQIKITALPGVSQTNVTGLLNASICGGNNGSISLQPLDGMAPYTFSWTRPDQSIGTLTGVGAGGGTINGLSQGGYRITVTDATGAGGCSMVLPSLVVNAPGLTVQAPVITQPTCPEGTGSVGVVVMGVNPTFSWSHGATTSFVNNLLPDTYTVTITDGSCQQVIQGIAITAPPPIQILSNKITQIDCFGNANGVIDLEVIGGSPAYTWLWNDGINTLDRSGLVPGNYRLTVTDARQCSAVSNLFTINSPAPLSISGSSTPVSCFGGSNGTAQITISGGTTPFLTEWNTGIFGPALTAIEAGSYTASVSDANGCSAIRTVQVQSPSAINIQSTSIQQPTCVGVNNGSITAQVSGGTAPYSYMWSSGSASLTTNGLSAGTYHLSVSDAQGCHFTSQGYTLSAPQLLTLQVDSLAQIRCFGGNNGYIKLSVSGNVGTLSLTSNGVPVGNVQSLLGAGLYQIRAEDQRGCDIEQTITLTQPGSTLTPHVVQVINAPCAGTPTGSIEINVTGGTPPYAYQWNTGATTQNLEVVPTGEYSVQVKDHNNCIAGITAVSILEPSPVVLSPIIEPIPCFGAPYGNIQLAVTGGQPPYSYQWSTGSTASGIFDLTAGAYQVSVFDTYGCFSMSGDLMMVDKSQDFLVQITDNNPVSCYSSNNGSLKAQVFNGRPPYQYAWSAPVGLHANQSSNTDVASSLSGGLYSVTVTDADGCFQTAGPVLVEESPPVAIQIYDIEHIICKGGSTGVIEAGASGGVPPLVFQWSNGGNTATLDSIPAGNYRLTVTDSRGCTSSSSLLPINEPQTGLSIHTNSVTEDACNAAGGEIDVAISGGYVPYTYLWSTEAVSQDIFNLTTGTYTLTVTDQQGCTDLETWTLQPPPPSMTLISYNIVDVACKGGTNGAISTGVTGGNIPLSYFWNNGSTGPNVTGLTAGLYRVTVTDHEGCNAVFNLPEVTEPDLPLIVSYTSQLQPSGYTVNLLCYGGTPGYNAVWDNAAGNQTGLIASNLAAGSYLVTVTDDGGCSKIVTIFPGSVETDEISAANNITVSPNPFGEYIRASWPSNSQTIAQIRLVSILGFEIQKNEDISGNEVFFETKSLTPGFYNLEVVYANGQRTTTKMIKTY